MTTDRFETTFSIAASPDVVWKRLDQRDGEGHWFLPAFEALGEEIDVEAGSSGVQLNEFHVESAPPSNTRDVKVPEGLYGVTCSQSTESCAPPPALKS